YKGDVFQNAFYVNPGQPENNQWITVELERKDKKNIIGTRIKLTITEDGMKRNIYRDVNSGGSFGASPLRREIGVGKATMIERLEIQWPFGETEIFENIKPGQFLRIAEGKRNIEMLSPKQLVF